VLALAGLVAASVPASAELRAPARRRAPPPPPMRFVHVRSANPACAPDCPEWLSAEGQIVNGSARAFKDAIEKLNGRRLPVLIHSPGGSVPDALAMGELIRVSGLAVAVARTLIVNCPEAAPRCPDGPATAITGGATCASACVLVLAGGVERLAGPAPLIGVHQTTTTVKEIEGAAHLTSTRKFYEQPRVDTVVGAYLAAMGVGEPVMTLMRKTPAASIRWLSLDELRASRLATETLDSAEPIATSGPNGLNARAFDGGERRSDLIEASLERPVAGRAATVEVALRYRRGGGMVEAEAKTRDLKAGEGDQSPAPDLSLTLRAPGAAPLQLPAPSATGASALIRRERFCDLAHGGATIAASGPDPEFPPVELSALDGAKALIAEACP